MIKINFNTKILILMDMFLKYLLCFTTIYEKFMKQY